ncbi:hypothetical protein [Saccharopolyspora shandongensis]|uniref:hypothetical protein n=1 Tax=Saccharopolyspora shandongensis TaxID=418495 RepID=UPI0033EC7BAA
MTESQFLLVYTGLVLVAVAVRVVVTDGVLGVHRFDAPDVFFLLVMAIGLLRFGAEYIVRDAGGPLIMLFFASGFLWFMSYRYGPSVVRRPLFWTVWVITMAVVLVAGIVLSAQASVSDGGAVGAVVGMVMMMVMMMAMTPSRGGSSLGHGGGDGGGGDGGC